jgi:hypothetical protein
MNPGFKVYQLVSGHLITSEETGAKDLDSVFKMLFSV